MTPAEFDAILLADPDAFDDEDREFFKDQAGQLDDSVREGAIVRREEMRRRRGWVGDIPQQPEPEEGVEEDDPALQAAYLDYLTKRAQITTPYHHLRDYDVEKQGGQEEWQRVLVLNFDEGEGAAGASSSGSSSSSLPIIKSEQSYRIDASSSNASQKVAYYHPIIDRMTLRVKRSTKRGAAGGLVDQRHWSNIALAHRDLTPKQLKRRLRRRGQVEKIDLGELLEIDSDDSDAEGEEAAEEEEQEEEEDAEGEAEEEQEEEEQKGATKPPASDSGSGSGDDDDDDDEEEGDEDLDDDELAGLREEAGGDDDDDDDATSAPATGGGRGSRRAAAASAAAGAGAETQTGDADDKDGDTAMDTDE